MAMSMSAMGRAPASGQPFVELQVQHKPVELLVATDSGMQAEEEDEEDDSVSDGEEEEEEEEEDPESEEDARLTQVQHCGITPHFAGMTLKVHSPVTASPAVAHTGLTPQFAMMSLKSPASTPL